MATNELDASEVRAWMLPEQIEAVGLGGGFFCEGKTNGNKKYEEMEILQVSWMYNDE